MSMFTYPGSIGQLTGCDCSPLFGPAKPRPLITLDYINAEMVKWPKVSKAAGIRVDWR